MLGISLVFNLTRAICLLHCYNVNAIAHAIILTGYTTISYILVNLEDLNAVVTRDAYPGGAAGAAAPPALFQEGQRGQAVPLNIHS